MNEARIFISYRRADSSGWAGRLHADLQRRFGPKRVFRDVAIPPGADFREHIEGVMDRCEVLLVVIGPEWTSITGADGRRRLDRPDDLVRLEIQRALERPDVTVIPVLVEGAPMPSLEELPEGLQDLRRLNAFELADRRWDHDIQVLVDSLTLVLGDSTVHAAVAEETVDDLEPAATPALVRGQAALAVIALGALATVLSFALSNSLRDDRPDTAAGLVERMSTYGGERAILWSLIGGVVLTAAHLFLRRAISGAPAMAILGIAVGAVGGALGGGAYMALKDTGVTDDEILLHAANVGITGAVLGGAFRRLAEPGGAAHFGMAGLVGGLLAGAVGRELFGDEETAAIFALQSAILLAAIASLIAAPARTIIPGGFTTNGRCAGVSTGG